MSQADLEISLFRRDAGGDNGSYGVELRFGDPQNEAEKRQGGLTRCTLTRSSCAKGCSTRRLRPISGRATPGRAGRALFLRPGGSRCSGAGRPFRLRLDIAPGAPELHSLRWETLRLPEASAPLLTGENLRFSRFLSAWTGGRCASGPKASSGRSSRSPARVMWRSIAWPRWTRRSSWPPRGPGWATSPTVELATRGQVTLKNLVARLRDGYDILYLVAHGMLVDGEPWLFLEDEDGATERVSGRELADAHPGAG